MIYMYKKQCFFSHICIQNVYTLCLVYFNQSCIATGIESERTSRERQRETERMCVCAFKPKEDVKLLYWKTEWKGEMKERSCLRAWRRDEFHWSLCWLTGNRGMKCSVLSFTLFISSFVVLFLMDLGMQEDFASVSDFISRKLNSKEVIQP